MNISELDQLMNTVLDGEATAAEAGELDRQLVADPAARKRFEEFRRLFDGLGSVPKAFPPEGLVAAVMAAAPRRPAGRRLRQLFAGSGVIRQVSMGPRGTSPGSSARVHQASHQGPQQRGYKMNQQKNGLIGKRSVWIGAGIAAVAVVLVLQYVDFPPGSKDVSGTIVPAQRYRADQPNAADVKLGEVPAPVTVPNKDPDNAQGGSTQGGSTQGGSTQGGSTQGGSTQGGSTQGGSTQGGSTQGGSTQGGSTQGGSTQGGSTQGGSN
jgi:anti-sigma factor RsiW